MKFLRKQRKQIERPVFQAVAKIDPMPFSDRLYLVMAVLMTWGAIVIPMSFFLLL